MTFLKKFGTALLRIVGIVAGVAPLVQAELPAGAVATVQTGVDKLTQLFNVIVTMEGAFAAVSGPDAKTGGDKLKASVPFVSQLVQSSEVLVGKKIKNEALFTQGCTSVASGLADVLNAIE
jgi:hypothetical protein